MKKLSPAFPSGHISLVMLGQTMYYEKASMSLGHRMAKRIFGALKKKPAQR
ncbi:MAG: hypothetical protein WCV85_06705 [Patescibacteria group bacterium]|jgi:hypothetical protein